MMHRIMILLMVAGMAAPSPAWAQEAGSRMTREFVQAAGQSDTFEMLEAQAALTQSGDAKIRDYAQHMLRDHGETRRMLGDATTRAGLRPPPMAVSDDQARLLGTLQGLNGPEFDQAYVRHQALAHRSALTVEQQYAAGGDDPAVRQAAVSATTVIAAHLAEAERMRVELGTP